MIHVRFRTTPEAPWVHVIWPEDKLEAVLRRASERIYLGPVDVKAEAESEARYQAVMRGRLSGVDKVIERPKRRRVK